MTKRLRTFGRRSCLRAALWLETAADRLSARLNDLADWCVTGRANPGMPASPEGPVGPVPSIERPYPEHLASAIKVLESERSRLLDRYVQQKKQAEALRESEELAELPTWIDNNLANLITEQCAIDVVRGFLVSVAGATETAPFRCLVVDERHESLGLSSSCQSPHTIARQSLSTAAPSRASCWSSHDD